MFERYTTLDQVRVSRLDYWNELVGRLFDGMTVSGRHSIDAAWAQCRFGDIGVALACSQKSVVSRWSDSGPFAPSGRVLLHLQHSGVSRTEQGRAAAVLCAGEMTTCRPDEPYRIDISDRNEMFVLDLPVSAFGDLAPRLWDGDIRVLRREVPAVGLLHDFVGSLFRQRWTLPPERSESDALGQVLTTLVRNSVAPEQASLAPRRDNRQRILAFVEEHLFDSGLRTSVIAGRLSMSVRSVQATFAEMATTPTAFITERRLAAAMDRIRQGRDMGTVTELAHDLGFCDAAHLARRFRARFGMSPGAYVKRCRGLH